MKSLHRKFVFGFAIIAGIILGEGKVFSQDSNGKDLPNQSTVQSDDRNVSIESPENTQDRTNKPKTDNTENLQKNQVKKIQNSKPDLSKRRGARPPSIGRPSGSGMPKGAGKPAGVSRPGRK